MANKKFMCVKKCYRRTPANQWKLYDLGDTEWFDPELHRPSPKHWQEVPTGSPLSAADMLRMMCREIGIEADPEWDVYRLQREYDHAIETRNKEQDKRVMARTVSETDATEIQPQPPKVEVKKGK